jgi:hypothetical protein
MHIVYNKGLSGIIGPEGARVAPMCWLELTPELNVLWQKNSVIKALVEKGVLEFTEKQQAKEMSPDAEAVKVATPDIPEKLKQTNGAKVEIQGTKTAHIQRGKKG